MRSDQPTKVLVKVSDTRTLQELLKIPFGSEKFTALSRRVRLFFDPLCVVFTLVKRKEDEEEEEKKLHNSFSWRGHERESIKKMISDFFFFFFQSDTSSFTKGHEDIS